METNHIMSVGYFTSVLSNHTVPGWNRGTGKGGPLRRKRLALVVIENVPVEGSDLLRCLPRTVIGRTVAVRLRTRCHFSRSERRIRAKAYDMRGCRFGRPGFNPGCPEATRRIAADGEPGGGSDDVASRAAEMFRSGVPSGQPRQGNSAICIGRRKAGSARGQQGGGLLDKMPRGRALMWKL